MARLWRALCIQKPGDQTRKWDGFFTVAIPVMRDAHAEGLYGIVVSSARLSPATHHQKKEKKGKENTDTLHPIVPLLI